MAKSATRRPSQRQLRVGEELRHALAQVLGKAELRDPALSGASVTVTEVRVGPDLRSATVFVLPLGGHDTAAVLAGLGRAAPHLRAQVARLVHLKFMPRLTFCVDTSFDHAEHIERLLREPDVAADVASDGHDDTDAA